MATVNFSVPDDVKEDFDAVFGDRNKSAVIAELMRRAVSEHKLQQRRQRLFQKLSRTVRRPAGDREIRTARNKGRP